MKRYLGRVAEGLARNVRDLHVYGGVGLIAVGVWEMSRSWSLVVVGALFLVLGSFWPKRT